MSALDDKLAELSARFAARAPDHLAAVSSAVAADDRNAVIEQAHRLAGIAGMFGHQTIGAAALALENAVRAGGAYQSEAARLTDLLARL